MTQEEKIKKKEEKNRRKAEMAEKAMRHVEYTEKEFAAEIRHSIENTKVYSPDSFDGITFSAPKHEPTEIIVCDLDSVSAAYQFGKENRKTAILNFADFTRIGGAFIKGSNAQEECLCHESTLYSVQKAHSSYYDENAGMGRNNGMYHNRALYSEDIVFIHEGAVRKFDVITCAAPNFWRQCFGKVSVEENNRYLKDRIRFVLQIARDNEVDLLLLGAFGCGVFSQNPKTAAGYFKEYLDGEFAGVFETVIFPVPAGRKSKNYFTFKAVFEGEK